MGIDRVGQSADSRDSRMETLDKLVEKKELSMNTMLQTLLGNPEVRRHLVAGVRELGLALGEGLHVIRSEADLAGYFQVYPYLEEVLGNLLAGVQSWTGVASSQEEPTAKSNKSKATRRSRQRKKTAPARRKRSTRRGAVK